MLYGLSGITYCCCKAILSNTPAMINIGLCSMMSSRSSRNNCQRDAFCKILKGPLALRMSPLPSDYAFCIVHHNFPQHNGWLHPLGGCGVRAFATESTTMRVEQSKSREIAQSGASRCWAAFAIKIRALYRSSHLIRVDTPFPHRATSSPGAAHCTRRRTALLFRPLGPGH